MLAILQTQMSSSGPKRLGFPASHHHQVSAATKEEDQSLCQESVVAQGAEAQEMPAWFRVIWKARCFDSLLSCLICESAGSLSCENESASLMKENYNGRG